MRPARRLLQPAFARTAVAGALALLAACSPAGEARAPSNTAAVRATVGEAGPVKWNDFAPALFARAKAEGRYVILDGAAEWCHFCHVMDEQTYADPRVQEVLGKHFLASKVDVDTRPDIEERYGDWGWPATIIFSPDGQELGKYRGYIPPEDFLVILNDVVSGRMRAVAAAPPLFAADRSPLPKETLDFARAFTDLELEEFWDKKEGGWGKEPKVPIGWNALYALAGARQGDARLKEHALTLLERQTKIIDPVWGGIYQYSVAPDWDHPHFEKLMFWNAGALAAYAEAFALTKDGTQKKRADDIRRWLEAFMVSEGGGFYGTQDADLNSHAASVPHAPTSPRGRGELVKGEDYYKLGDRERRSLGVPRIDPNEYADDNGLAIYAYATYARATGDAAALAIAKRAAARIVGRHLLPDGGVLHVVASAPKTDGKEAPPKPKLHLADAAALGFGLVHLDGAAKTRAFQNEAKQIAAFLEKQLYDEKGGGFFSEPDDPNAVGVFRSRRKPFDDNVLALRFLVELDTQLGVAAHRALVEHGLRALTSPQAIKDRGKFLGDYLLLLGETVAHRSLPASSERSEAPPLPSPSPLPAKAAATPAKTVAKPKPSASDPTTARH